MTDSLVVTVCDTSSHYSHKVQLDSDLVLPACGELVVARCMANERWYRASVIGRDLEHNIKVGNVSQSSLTNKFQFPCVSVLSIVCLSLP